MPFTDEQLKQLKAPLSPSAVKKRSGFDYIEGWHAIAEANRIFGFDGWASETVGLTETNRELVDTGNKKQWRVGYIAKVRISVEGVIREGTGYGSGFANPTAVGEAIESAIKEAETDARKRALMTFGNPFGLALYDKTKANVGEAESEDDPAPKANGNGKAATLPKAQAARSLYTELQQDIDSADSVSTLKTWGSARKSEVETLPADWQGELRTRYSQRMAVLSQAPEAAHAR